MILDKDCKYSDALEVIQKVGSFNQCQMFCTMSKICSYFLYDFKSTTCSLLGDETMSCKETVSTHDADLSKCEGFRLENAIDVTSLATKGESLSPEFSAPFLKEDDSSLFKTCKFKNIGLNELGVIIFLHVHDYIDIAHCILKIIMKIFEEF